MNKYLGPFEVVQRVGKVAYERDLPANLQIHDVFHFSLKSSSIGGKWC